MTRKLVVSIALCGACVAAISQAARAQDPILTELYGSGVHDYFSGTYQQAVTDLTEAVDGKSKDPRVLYFRALAWLRLGDTTKAQADFAAGTKLEGTDVNGYYPVSKSLERVQGSGRLMLEKYRVQARSEAYRRADNLARYEAQRRAEAEVLRATPPPPAPGQIAAPVAGAAPATPAAEKPAEKPAAEPADDADPFSDDADKSADAMPDKGGAAEEPAAEEDAASSDDEMPAEDAGESMEDDSENK